jgi:hypothetical protein
VTKSDELQKLFMQSLSSKDYDPILMQKVIQYCYDNALFAPVWAGARGDVIKPWVKDTGLYTLQSWGSWKPAEAWLDK